MSESTVAESFGRELTECMKPLPKVKELHHYTSFDAVKEILCSDTLNLSHAAFTNDLTELRYGLEMIRDMYGDSGKKAFASHDFPSIL